MTQKKLPNRAAQSSSRAVKSRVEFREASPPGYELGSRGIELSRVLELAVAE
jgi:hypothetical protein